METVFPVEGHDRNKGNYFSLKPNTVTKEILEMAEKINELNNYGKKALFITLFNKKMVQFTELTEAYVSSLQEEIETLQDKNSKLLLYTASYCAHDKSPWGKFVRKYIYDTGGFTASDGSVFGKMLEEEFSNDKTAPAPVTGKK